jgi:plasmid segregation protein ParM
MRIAVDVGFGFIKAMNESLDTVRFPSVVSKKSENSLKGIVGGSGDDYSVTYWEVNNSGENINQKKLYVGDAGLSNGGTRKWEDKDKFNVEDLKLFIVTAVGLLNPQNDVVDLCLGLPMSYYLTKKDELNEGLKDLNARISITGQRSLKEVKFNSIFVFPQGAGAYYSSFCDIDGTITDYDLAQSNAGVIDIGYRTVDFLVMMKGRNGIQISDNLSGSLEEDGMNVAFQNIQNAVSNDERVNKEVALEEIEKAILWFNSKFDFRRDSIDITQYEDQAYKESAEEICSKIKIRWGAEGDLLSRVVITGGGAEELFPYMRDKFDTAVLQEDCAYGNCKGYLAAQAIKMKG